MVANGLNLLRNVNEYNQFPQILVGTVMDGNHHRKFCYVDMALGMLVLI